MPQCRQEHLLYLRPVYLEEGPGVLGGKPQGRRLTKCQEWASLDFTRVVLFLDKVSVAVGFCLGLPQGLALIQNHYQGDRVELVVQDMVSVAMADQCSLECSMVTPSNPPKHKVDMV